MVRDRRRSLQGVLMVVALLVISAGSAVVGFVWNADYTVNDRLTRVDAVFPAEAVRPPATEANGATERARTILMVGSTTLPRQATTKGFSADSLMVVRLADDRERVDIISFPSDAMVRIPGFGVDRISAATTRGGLPLAVQTVETLLGSRVDHVVAIDLDGVVEVTDAVGGVDVQVRQPFRAGRHSYRPGEHRLDGVQALAFVREQASLPGRDLDRNAHQREYLRGLASEITGADLIAQPARLIDTLAVAADHVAVDSDLTPANLRTLAFSLRSLRPSQVHTWSAPVESVRVRGAGPLTVQLSETGLDRLRTALTEDDFTGYS